VDAPDVVVDPGHGRVQAPHGVPADREGWTTSVSSFGRL
jgi:hypothetical protein